MFHAEDDNYSREHRVTESKPIPEPRYHHVSSLRCSQPRPSLWLIGENQFDPRKREREREREIHRHMDEEESRFIVGERGIYDRGRILDP